MSIWFVTMFLLGMMGLPYFFQCPIGLMATLPAVAHWLTNIQSFTVLPIESCFNPLAKYNEPMKQQVHVSNWWECLCMCFIYYTHLHTAYCKSIKISWIKHLAVIAVSTLREFNMAMENHNV